uniref:ATP synthase F0 subunit 8 n=1 Tax=Sastragala esakii TaxID=483949 RepID=UPI001D12FE6E|nr:ATP synthase F0 subunit 8 [Sastragala esakii]UCC46107.1 ATP synthase F0 subunit 8 [Sastragala esakii]
MPQMSPMWWEILFIEFMLLLMIMLIMIYHNKKMMNNKSHSLNNVYKQMIWKW